MLLGCMPCLHSPEQRPRRCHLVQAAGQLAVRRPAGWPASCCALAWPGCRAAGGSQLAGPRLWEYPPLTPSSPTTPKCPHLPPALQVSRHKRCRVRVTVSERPGAVPQGGHKVSLTAVMVSHFPVRLTVYDGQVDLVNQATH